MSQRKIHTYEFVKEQFENKNCIPKFTEYINNHTKLDYICPNGHEHSIAYKQFKNDHGCNRCAGNIKSIFEDVQNYFIQVGCIPKFIEYINNKQKLDYICPNGHRHSITYKDLKSGKGCSSCSGNAKLTFEKVQQDFIKKGCVPKFTEYKNAHIKLNYICPNGHKHSITWNSWQQGTGCPYCDGQGKPEIEFIIEEFKKDDYIPKFTEYKNAHTKLDYICPKGHEHFITWNDWKSGCRCPKCAWSNGTSKFEQEVKDFVLSLNQEIIENDRTTIMGNKGKYLELDILFPCKTKAVECNGFYWHSLPEVIEKDEIKQKQCKEKGIKLLTIDELLWYNNREECEKIINNFIT